MISYTDIVHDIVGFSYDIVYKYYDIRIRREDAVKPETLPKLRYRSFSYDIGKKATISYTIFVYDGRTL